MLRRRQRGFLLNPYRFGQPTDPFFANVSSLLHFDGGDGSTTILDSGPSPKTYTVAGSGVALSTGQSKFGGASLRGQAAGGNVSTPNNAAFAFGSGQFTIEGWFRLSDVTNIQQFMVYGKPTVSGGADLAFGVLFLGSGIGSKIRAFVYNGATQTFIDSTTIPAINTWYAVSFCRDAGNTLRLHINGIQEGTIAAVTVNNDAAFTLRMGLFDTGSARSLNGYLDEWRITKGVGRYSAASYTPTGPFPNS